MHAIYLALQTRCQVLLLTVFLTIGLEAHSQSAPNPVPQPSSYAPVKLEEPFEMIRRCMEQAKPEIMLKHKDFLAGRYDLADRPAVGVAMTRGKPVQQGARTRLKPGITWEMLAELTADEIRTRDLYPIISSYSTASSIPSNSRDCGSCLRLSHSSNSPRRAPAHPRRHDRVFQPDPRDATHCG
jgi:hypothetical protein